MTSRVLKDS
jgi:cytochrome P450